MLKLQACLRIITNYKKSTDFRSRGSAICNLRFLRLKTRAAFGTILDYLQGCQSSALWRYRDVAL